MPIRRIPRNNLKFDGFDAVATFGLEKKLSLRSPETLETFFQEFKDAFTNNLDSPIFLFGQRTEAMFEAMVIELGRVKLLRKEDVGEIFVDDEEMKIPDFRIILEDGRSLLVEVKSHHPKNDPFSPFSTRSIDLEGLQAYARLNGLPLLYAIYWSKFNSWTLVPETAFSDFGSRRTITFPNAMMANHMADLGDIMVATVPPLRMRLLADPSKPRSLSDDGEVAFTIGDIEFFSNETEITNQLERNIAFNLMLFGRWMEEGPRLTMSDGEVNGVEFLTLPEEASGQGFEIVASLSELFSQYFLFQTDESELVQQTRANFSPGRFGRLIPDEYKGESLPLWRFQLQPSSPSEH